MAHMHMLTHHLTKPFVPAIYQDDHRELLASLIQKKILGKEMHIPQIENKSTILDLMSALQASLNSYKSLEEKQQSKAKRKYSKKNLIFGETEVIA
jgi:non-homologous end joining protein Ku